MESCRCEIDRLKTALDIDEALIYALYLRLRSEIETREAIVDAIANGAGPEALEAIAGDPVPIVDDLGHKRTVAGLVDAFRRAHAGRRDELFGVGH